MAVVGMKQLLEAGVHFGHQTRRWNPKMKPYIYTERNGIHIIDLQKTVGLLEQAYDYVRDITRNGGKVLFVGTKRQAQEATAEEAARAGQFYVNVRWLGGLLTNFQTIQQRLRRMEELEQMRDTGRMAGLTKKEQLQLMDELARLNRLLGGIRGMRRMPEALFIIDTKKEHIAVHEANRLGIPIVALLDTNSDPDEVSLPIPANDDAIRAVRLLAGKMADAALEGAQERASTMAKEEAEEGFEPESYEGYTFEPEGYEASLEGDSDADESDNGLGEDEEPPLAASGEERQPDEALEVAEMGIGAVATPELAAGPIITDVPEAEQVTVESVAEAPAPAEAAAAEE